MHSLVLIVPATALTAANAQAAELLGGAANFTIPIGADGQITHVGLRADIGAEQLQCLRECEMLGDAIWDVSNDPAADEDARHSLWGREHTDAVLAAHGLERVAG